MTGVLIYAETRNSAYSRKTRELICGARMIADILREPIAAAVLKTDAQPAYHPEAYCAGLEHAAKTTDARVVILYGDITGKDIAPRIAWRMRASIITDVIAVQSAPDNSLRCVRLAHGGKTEVVIIPKLPLVLTLKPKAFEPVPENEGATDITGVAAAYAASEAGLRLAQILPAADDASSVKLEDAQVVISGGRGMKDDKEGNGQKGFAALRELAQILRGAVGASRAATDAGWTPDSMQVGQTGKTVNPTLYMAFGISGATQHVAGMSGSKTIVAVNKDRNAPIFKTAHLGIIREWQQFLPAFIAECRKHFEEKQ